MYKTPYKTLRDLTEKASLVKFYPIFLLTSYKLELEMLIIINGRCNMMTNRVSLDLT